MYKFLKQELIVRIMVSILTVYPIRMQYLNAMIVLSPTIKPIVCKKENNKRILIFLMLVLNSCIHLYLNCGMSSEKYADCIFIFVVTKSYGSVNNLHSSSYPLSTLTKLHRQ